MVIAVRTSAAIGMLAVTATAFSVSPHGHVPTVASGVWTHVHDFNRLTPIPRSLAAGKRCRCNITSCRSSGGGKPRRVAPLRMAGGWNPHKEVEERAKINTLITTLSGCAEAEWKPDLVDSYADCLLRGSLYRQAIDDRMAKVENTEEQKALVRVDAFLSGYLSQERRRASRRKVSDILKASLEGPVALDQCVKTLAMDGVLDDDLQEYLDDLVRKEARKPSAEPTVLLKILNTVKTRVEAEIKTE
ncbi:unnamed protein product [Discosporangium mesarthrocarpum]